MSARKPKEENKSEGLILGVWQQQKGLDVLVPLNELQEEVGQGPGLGAWPMAVIPDQQN